MVGRRTCGVFLVLLVSALVAGASDGGRSLLQLGGDAQGVGNELDNCSGYSAEQLLNFLAGVISGSPETPAQLLTDSQPNNCKFNGGGAAANPNPAKQPAAKGAGQGKGAGPGPKGRRLASASHDRKLLQLNKICAGLQCLEQAITTKLSGAGTTADQVTQTIVNYCDNQIDGSGTATVGQVYTTVVKLFPAIGALDSAITADLAPLCQKPLGK